ncbi:hypothetical protein EV645_5978 [Kribbella rubisoli]|uniref:Uncharacterized protein n=1 Tax=Kribbella rubisoli TaxID=3075929 RepID=A0A4Q7WSZ6_9ACTN|nr:hypothetical protein [Kribbella rubisoli]RZU12705.1 hypothetical protein EV645_5978 [Kribbella rubisoli]
MSEAELWAMPHEYGAGAASWVSNAVDSISRELHPILAAVRRERVADLPRPEEHSPGAEVLASPLYRGIEVMHVVTADRDDVLMGDVGAFLGLLFNLADEMGSQMMRGMLEHISEVCEASGQVVSAEGRDYYDVMIETLETIDMSFDENGKSNLFMVVSPAIAKELEGNPPTPEQEARMTRVLERRKEEWDASRRRRDLP